MQRDRVSYSAAWEALVWKDQRMVSGSCGQEFQAASGDAGSVVAGELADAITWFKTLPVAIEIGGIRVAHASWQKRDIDCLNEALADAGRFAPDFLAMSEDPGSELNNAIENVLKGPELKLPGDLSVVDKAGHRRDSVRIKLVRRRYWSNLSSASPWQRRSA
ncbi:hypothetical protein PSR62_13100 [Rhodopirellula sp. P2]|nr:hypothetical protein [Rhodopirellula sp. P2]WDQ19573.1 hypothetical protein PSR62_13100 [Rhodopirellula sp. P2]